MADPDPPGTYIDEIRGPRPIAGVATDIAGFVGVTAHGPATPTLVTSWADFVATFGDVIDAPPFVTPYWRLPYAVRGFFENGGRRLYVARVLDAAAPAGTGDPAAFAGDASATDATGLAGLMARSDVALIAVPDEVVLPAVSAALVDACDRAGDRLAILSGVSGGAAPASVRPPCDSRNAAFYYPHLHVPAPHLPGGDAVVPPCGHVAGCLARAAVGAAAHPDDRAPALAGLVADGPDGGIAPLDRRVSARDSEALTARGVNALRDFRAGGRGVRVWGARTTSSDPEWKYVPVRRLFLYLERSIEQGTQWAVFEPNTAATWTAVRGRIETFLLERWRAGAFAGVTPRDAFFVRCDRATMTQDDLDNGRLVCLIGVAPLRPAEFVIFRIGQWTADRP